MQLLKKHKYKVGRGRIGEDWIALYWVRTKTERVRMWDRHYQHKFVPRWGKLIYFYIPF